MVIDYSKMSVEELNRLSLVVAPYLKQVWNPTDPISNQCERYLFQWLWDNNCAFQVKYCPEENQILFEINYTIGEDLFFFELILENITDNRNKVIAWLTVFHELQEAKRG